MEFQDADIRQLVQRYAELTGREALPLQADLGRAKFSIRAQQELTPAEAVFALEAVAALNNLRIKLVDGNKVQIVPSASRRTPC